MCCYGGDGLFDFLWVSCGRGGGDGFFSGGSGGFLVTEVVVMGGWNGDSEEKINRLMGEKGVKEIGLYNFIE